MSSSSASPVAIAEYRHEEATSLANRIPTADLVIRDLVKDHLLLPVGMSSYPIIRGEGWPRQDIGWFTPELSSRERKS